MAAVTPENKEIYEEDIKAGSSLAEGMLVKFAAMMNWLRANCGDYVGKKEMAALSEAQFAAVKKYSLAVPEAQKKWVLMKGQSIAGSKYALLTGITTLPNAVDYGAHPEQAASGASLLQYFASQNKTHTHSQKGYIGSGSGVTGRVADTMTTGALGYIETESSGSNVARPNSFTTNFFIMIND